MGFQNHCCRMNGSMHGYEGTIVKQKMEFEGRLNKSWPGSLSICPEVCRKIFSISVHIEN